MAANNSPKEHSLEGESFQKALQRYADETKPDPLVLKQIQGWEMQWSEGNSIQIQENINPDLSFEPTDVLQGTLTWKSDYMVAEIECSCCWEPHQEKNLETIKQPTKGSLYFVLGTKLRFRSKNEKKSETEPKKSKEEKKSEEKIRTKMIQRLKEDTFIKRLLPDNKKSASSEKAEASNTAILCEARLSVSNSSCAEGQLEERVDVTDNIAEGLRRAVFSQAESALDVIEILLSLPLLPGSAHDLDNIHCPLADRAKLRLLEDAMFDACEREGEDEIIDDLKISPTAGDSHSHHSDGVNNSSEGGGHKKPKTQQNRSNKRTKR